MSRLAIAATVFLTVAVLPPVVAQSPAPSDGSGASPAAQTQEKAKPPARSDHDARKDADARRCLEFPTDPQVIMCAEKYLSNKRKS